MMIVRIPFFFNDTATTEIYTLSRHDALPIWNGGRMTTTKAALAAGRTICALGVDSASPAVVEMAGGLGFSAVRSEEHTSELQSRQSLVCRLLLEKKTMLYSAIKSTNNTPFHS